MKNHRLTSAQRHLLESSLGGMFFRLPEVLNCQKWLQGAVRNLWLTTMRASGQPIEKTISYFNNINDLFEDFRDDPSKAKELASVLINLTKEINKLSDLANNGTGIEEKFVITVKKELRQFSRKLSMFNEFAKKDPRVLEKARGLRGSPEFKFGN